MLDTPSQLARTLRRQRNRFIAASGIDAGVAAIAAGAVVAAASILFGFSPLAPSLIAGGAGFGFSWRRIPSLSDVATWLDQQNDLSDLLASAWATRDRDEPWAVAIGSIAAARAAALPPSPWPGRWSPRQHLCGLAMAAALLLATQLVGPASAPPREDQAASATPVATRQVDSKETQIADVRQRAGDTAGSVTHWPGAQAADETAGSDERRASTPTTDARGTGRADSDMRSVIDIASQSSSVLHESGRSGSGERAESYSGDSKDAGSGVVAEKHSGRATSPRVERFPIPVQPTARMNAAAPPVAYRDLVADFFER